MQRGLLRLFARYTAWYLRRHFHALRVAGVENTDVPADRPLIIAMNHPSWWDPLIALTLAVRLFPARTHFAPMDAAALSKYKFFARLGFFGVERESRRGAATFLRMGEAVLRSPSSALWVTAQGEFSDARVRPVVLKPGVEHLRRRVPDAVVLPVALEYTFWQERTPEVLVRIGAAVASGSDIARALEDTQDRLASDSIARRCTDYRSMLDGVTGVGGVYDLWRAVTSRVRRRHFDPAHGSEGV